MQKSAFEGTFVIVFVSTIFIFSILHCTRIFSARDLIFFLYSVLALTLFSFMLYVLDRKNSSEKLNRDAEHIKND